MKATASASLNRCSSTAVAEAFLAPISAEIAGGASLDPRVEETAVQPDCRLGKRAAGARSIVGCGRTER
jgi:hypothetical protein